MDPETVVEKVTAFITNASGQLLLLQHPYAGIQIPAGTVEEGETPETAVLREVAEETGLCHFSTPILLAQEVEFLPLGQRVIAVNTKVFARPDAASFDWTSFRRGITVTVRQQAIGFTQIEYVEHDQVPDPHYVTYRILGWVPDNVLATRRRRFFFRLAYLEPTPERWKVTSDNHTFTLFWVSISNLPDVVSPQNSWLQHLSC